MQHTMEQAAPATATGRSAALALLALAAASFGIGTTEFVIMGLLPEMAADLGVGIPKAGLLVSGYALSVTFGSPLVRRPCRASTGAGRSWCWSPCSSSATCSARWHRIIAC